MRFVGKVRENERERIEGWIYFSAPQVSNCTSNSPAMQKKLKERWLICCAKKGRGEILAIRTRKFLEADLEPQWVQGRVVE